MQDFVFDPHLGRRPTEGLGQVPTSKPPLPMGMQIVTAPLCQRWLLAFVSASRMPDVIIHGHHFGGYQSALDYFASLGASPVYFTYTNNRGTYLFAYEETKAGHKVIKICVDGMVVRRNSQGSWTVSPSAA
jgi:hypothetical protein